MNDFHDQITGAAPKPERSDSPGEPHSPAPWKVAYELTPEDGAAFLYHHAQSPPRPRGGIPHWFWLVVMCFFVAVWLVVKLTVQRRFTMSVPDWIMVVAVPWFLVFHFGGRRMAVWLMMRKARRTPGLFEKRALEITPERLRVYGSAGSEAIPWQAVAWIVVNAGYAFFYLTETQALVLPRRAFADGRQFEEFVDAARRYHAEARRFVKPEGQA